MKTSQAHTFPGVFFHFHRFSYDVVVGEVLDRDCEVEWSLAVQDYNSAISMSKAGAQGVANTV